MKTKVLILQNLIPHYRIPFFEQLGACTDIDLTVLHSGAPTLDPEIPHSYAECIVRARVSNQFVWQEGVSRAASNADVIIAMFDLRWINNVLIGIKSKSVRKKLIYWGHGYGRTRLAKPIRTFLARRADALLLYGGRDVEAFVERGVVREKIFFAPNTIYVPHKPLSNDSPRNSFLFVGRLQARKNIEDLLYAFHQAIFRLPNSVNLLIVGEGPRKKSLYMLAESLGISSRVLFQGRITESSALESLFGQSIAYVSPGATGLGVLHSFAHGVPVIVTTNANHGPEVGNLTEGENGFYYDGTISGLSEMLIRLSSDVNLHRVLGANALDYYWSNRTMSQMVGGVCDAIHYVQNEFR